MKYTIFRLPHCRGDREAWLLSDGGRNIPKVIGDWKPIKSGKAMKHYAAENPTLEECMLDVIGAAMTGCVLDGVRVLGVGPGDVIDITAEPNEPNTITGAWLNLEHGYMKLNGSFHEEAMLSMETGRWNI